MDWEKDEQRSNSRFLLIGSSGRYFKVPLHVFLPVRFLMSMPEMIAPKSILEPPGEEGEGGQGGHDDGAHY